MDDCEPSTHAWMIHYLVTHTQCSGCGQRYDASDVHIEHHRGEIWLAAVTCRRCGLEGLIVAALSQASAEQSGVTRARSESSASIGAMGPISAEEILQLHLFLQSFRGDMLALLKENQA